MAGCVAGELGRPFLQERQHALPAVVARAGDARRRASWAYEDMSVKKEIFARLNAAMPADAILATLKKLPVIAGVCDGFISIRILARYREIADMILMDGGLPWHIDETMVEFDYAMEPYAAQDLAGLDIAKPARRCSTERTFIVSDKRSLRAARK